MYDVDIRLQLFFPLEVIAAFTQQFHKMEAVFFEF